MNLTTFYITVVLTGSIQGILLACISIFNERFRKKSNLGASTSFLALGLFGLWYIIILTPLSDSFPLLLYLPFNYPILIPLGLYYSIVYFFEPNYSFQKRDYWIVLPLFVALIGNLLFYSNHLYSLFVLGEHTLAPFHFNLFFEVLSIFYLMWVIVFIYRKVDNHQALLFDNFANNKGQDLGWIKNLIYISLPAGLTWLFHVSYIITHGKISLALSAFIWGWVHVFLYYIYYIIVLKRELFIVPSLTDISPSNLHKSISPEKSMRTYLNIIKLMEEEKMYQDPEFNMSMLSKRINLSNRYISHVIKESGKVNFHEFVNAFRVKEVKKNLNNTDYSHFSILGIGLEAGFKSKSAFYAIFKKKTGMTPTAYKRSMKF